MNLSLKIKDEARKLGFDIYGIAKARPLNENKVVMQEWIDSGMNDEMKYLGRDLERRSDPSILFPGARSIVVTGMNYYTRKSPESTGVPIISMYTYGADYHEVIKNKLEDLLCSVKTWAPDTNGKAVVDTSPLMEKAWAIEAGIGWRGKHSVVINKSIGSFFFIGALILDTDLDFDAPTTGDICGNCRQCIENCPTGAINDNRTIDARKCIANLTIENRGPVPDDIVPNLGGRVYGCDRCQEVCPWNTGIKEHNHPEFTPNEEIMKLDRESWLKLREADFYRLFSNTAMNRVNYDQFMRNVNDALITGRDKY